MIRRYRPARRGAILAVLGSAILVLPLSGCIKTRADLKSEQGNPDSGYENKVTDVAADNQKVTADLREEITRLSERVDDLQQSNDVLTQEAAKRTEREAQMSDMQTKIQELQASQAALVDAIQKREKEHEEKVAKEQKENEIPKTDPESSFEIGKKAFLGKNYDDAVDAFNQYLKFPKGKFTEEALFYRGEAYYAKEHYKKAILDYSSLQEKYPKAKLIPKALLKIGMSFDALGMKSDAKAFYQEILDKHAKAPEAKLAKSKLR